MMTLQNSLYDVESNGILSYNKGRKERINDDDLQKRERKNLQEIEIKRAETKITRELHLN